MNLEAILQAMQPYPQASLVVVSKGQPLEAILELYSLGVRDFGENRVDEALSKMEQAPHDIRWHFIGKLQRKKVSKVIGKFFLIHSVDSLPLAEKLSQESEKRGLTTAILLEVNTSLEESKCGFTPEECRRLYPSLCTLKSLEIRGLMTMAPLTDDTTWIRSTFASLRALGAELHLPHLSMGMSHDYPIALAEGATLLRVGSAIFP